MIKKSYIVNFIMVDGRGKNVKNYKNLTEPYKFDIFFRNTFVTAPPPPNTTYPSVPLPIREGIKNIF